MGVRDERRVETTAAILDVARAHVARDGAAALSLRAVARDLDLAVSALYRYYRDRDALLTALITEAFHDVADHVGTAMGDPVRPTSRARRRAWTAAAVAYRKWAQEHPSRFLLIFGTPVPGYEAPAEPTRPAGTRIPRMLADLLVGVEVPRQRMDRPTRAQLTSLAGLLGSDVSADALAVGIAAWDAVHGHVMLELSGQFGPLTAADGLFSLVVKAQTERLRL